MSDIKKPFYKEVADKLIDQLEKVLLLGKEGGQLLAGLTM
ncbi:Uncharacterised protein [Phocoenobacter uteri]|uniref:Uncharacterized protein n=1 Tax=Phocoenobacter uteri TaxID=146806 RepID=A0A379DFN5_9PAST|nr:Uncharacterised protein [Phocoenobacter uteri]